MKHHHTLTTFNIILPETVTILNLSSFLFFVDNYYIRKRVTKKPNMYSLSQFVDQLSTEASAAAVPPPTGFPSVGGFNDNYTGALKWKVLIQDTIYQVRSARSINTQHGTSFILSLHTAEGFCYNAWACGMLQKNYCRVQVCSKTSIRVYSYDQLDLRRARMDEYTTCINYCSATEHSYYPFL